ncbi:hypothetical protein BD324DRAFT_678701 [Kockovaella imperatae]|uniref:Mitochondrial ribosomal protein L27-domain-containing protein n=1 Tax=Kockovaella imperatae TaxID=4999 RepID=A0A1Y1UNK8_9TREE|nr:hypothetical protein BD324DRAFT_678701 [Kockovaella imperatae]ORX39582.1 hypothetical protein BD324DRAFT_678701 [Kockovaella imperatae]
MKPTLPNCGARRLPLTSKQAKKDFYKGTGQAFAPGAGVRTGAPGKHVLRTRGYKLDDEKVRVFVAPPLSLLNETNLKPYVDRNHERPRSQLSALKLSAPPSGFRVFQRHALRIAPEMRPDVRSPWSKVRQYEASLGKGAPKGSASRIQEDRKMLQEELEMIEADWGNESDEMFSTSSSSSRSSAFSSSSSSSSSSSNITASDEADFSPIAPLSSDYPGYLAKDVQGVPQPFLQMNIDQLEKYQSANPYPPTGWDRQHEMYYRRLKWKKLLSPRPGSVNPLFWDHWKSLSEEQKEAYNFIAKRLWWDRCAMETQKASGWESERLQTTSV